MRSRSVGVVAETIQIVRSLNNCVQVSYIILASAVRYPSQGLRLFALENSLKSIQGRTLQNETHRRDIAPINHLKKAAVCLKFEAAVCLKFELVFWLRVLSEEQATTGA